MAEETAGLPTAARIAWVRDDRAHGASALAREAAAILRASARQGLQPGAGIRAAFQQTHQAARESGGQPPQHGRRCQYGRAHLGRSGRDARLAQRSSLNHRGAQGADTGRWMPPKKRWLAGRRPQSRLPAMPAHTSRDAANAQPFGNGAGGAAGLQRSDRACLCDGEPPSASRAA